MDADRPLIFPEDDPHPKLMRRGCIHHFALVVAFKVEQLLPVQPDCWQQVEVAVSASCDVDAPDICVAVLSVDCHKLVHEHGHSVNSGI